MRGPAMLHDIGRESTRFRVRVDEPVSGAARALSVIDAVAADARPMVRGLILVGCVVETPTVVITPLQRLDLVYGADDLVSYVHSSGALESVRQPKEYGPEVANRLVVLPRTNV